MRDSLLYFAVHPADSFPLPVVLWTQNVDWWSKLRGIAGNISSWLPLPVSELPFVRSATSPISRNAVDYDRVSGVVYWSQSPVDTSSNSWSIGAQPIVDALDGKSTPTMQFLSSWHIGGLAVDLFTGNVYVTETEHQLIAVARYDIHDADMYRVIISSGVDQPTAIALDPYAGLVLYWYNHFSRASLTYVTPCHVSLSDKFNRLMKLLVVCASTVCGKKSIP